MRTRCLAIVALLAVLGLLAVPVSGAEGGGGEWWDGAWACRKRVRVNLPAIKPLGFPYRPQSEAENGDTVPAEARIYCEAPPKSSAQREVRVVDPGGNVLPCVATGPDERGYVQVVFPARLRIGGETSEAISEDTKQVTLTCGRNQAVTPGLRFHARTGTRVLATLEVTEVADETAVATVVERRVPDIAKGTAVRSEELTDADYFIYYGNPDAAEDAPSWEPSGTAVRRYTWHITSGSMPTSLNALREVMREGVSYQGSSSLNVINSRSNAHVAKVEGYCLTAYEAFVEVSLRGLYRFSIDSTGSSYLFIDGEFVAERAGFHVQHGQWEHRGKVELEPGVHHLLMVAGEGQKRLMTRLGWQPVAAKVFSQTPSSFYLTRIPAEPVGFDKRDGGGMPFFTYSLAPRSITVGEGTRYQFVQFRNRTGDGEGAQEDTTYVWSFGDEEKSREREPGHLYAVGGEDQAFDVTLSVVRDGEAVGQYSRTVHCGERPAEALQLSHDIVSFPNIVYEDEQASVAVRLRNANRSPVPLRAVAVLRTRRDGEEVTETILRRRIVIRAEDESFCIVPVDMKDLPTKRAEVSLDFILRDQNVLSTGLRVMPSPGELTKLTGRLGGLYDAEGRRVMICLRLEDPDRHLRWVFYRYFRDNVYGRLAGTRKSILLFGDRMDNPVPQGESFTDYVMLLERAVADDRRNLKFVPRSEGKLPTLRDLVRFAKTLDGLEEPPDIVVLCPGLADVAQAVGERDFARSIDVMVDCIRQVKDRAKIVVVSPPPYPLNTRRSHLYTRELQGVVRDHHLPFINLTELLAEGDEDWAAKHYAAPLAEGVLLQNPNQAAHRAIAQAILDELR